jgi:hypothetical protein
MATATAVNATALVGELAVAVVVAIVGAVIAYLLGRNGTAQQLTAVQTMTTLKEQTVKLDLHSTSLERLTTALGPTVVELELHQIQIGDLKQAVAVLGEWRTAHDAWSKETIARLERHQPVSRHTDAT